MWKTRQASQALTEFKGLLRLDAISHFPVERQIPATRPNDEDFAQALAAVCSRDVRTGRPLPRSTLRDVQHFTMTELQKALKALARNKSADCVGIALEHLL